MDTEATNETSDTTDLLPTGTELRGSVLDVLKTLLGDHAERDTVLELVGKLVAREPEGAPTGGDCAAKH